MTLKGIQLLKKKLFGRAEITKKAFVFNRSLPKMSNQLPINY